MVKVRYIQPDGSEKTVDVNAGWSVMQAATAKGIDGIEAECGGSCNCATCHVYVDEADLARLPAPDEGEEAMLDNVACERKATSRLACQIKLTDAMDGLTVHLPERQS